MCQATGSKHAEDSRFYFAQTKMCFFVVVFLLGSTDLY